MLADAPTADSQGKIYGDFGGWGMAARKVEVLLVLSGRDVGWKCGSRP